MVRPTLEAKKHSPEDVEMHLPELVIVSRVEGSRQKPVQQGLNHLDL